MRILSMGGGVNSAACLVKYHDQYDAVVWADTGNESDETYQYIAEVIMPFCAERDLLFQCVRNKRSVLQAAVEDTQVGWFFRHRECTIRHKINPILKWVHSQKPKPDKHNPTIVDIGFALDESHRIGKDYEVQYATKNYPLCTDKITRDDCIAIIRQARIPVPPKSSCTFCPYAGYKKMRQFSVDNPQQFKMLIDAEERDPKFPKFTIFKDHKLRTMISNRKLEEFIPDDSCDSGHCFV